MGCQVKLPPVLRPFFRGVMNGGSGVSIRGVKIVRVDFLEALDLKISFITGELWDPMISYNPWNHSTKYHRV